MSEMRTTTYRDAIRDAIRDAMQRDDRVFLMGEDVGRYGGCFAVSRGLLDEFGPDRIRDTPLSESAFVGAGIGAALGGMRPIVEIMTCNFSLLALDQIVNNAATILHMSGGQFNVPVVIRMTTGAGRQLAAQHSHSFEGWYAHIPGIRIVAPATLEDARGMLWTALEDPDPVLIFENGLLYNMKGDLAADAGTVDIDRAAVRRAGKDVTLITYGGTLFKTLEAAQLLSQEGIEPEVLDLRALRPLDDETVFASVGRTHRAVVIDEGWRSGSISAEISARITENAFYELDAPVGRVCSAEVPMPYAKHLEDAAIPSVEAVVAAARVPRWVEMPEFRMPSLGADMDRGTVVEWRVKPGDEVKRGDIVAVVETDKSDIEVETFTGGVVDEILVPPGEEVEVGSVLAHFRAPEEATSGRRAAVEPPSSGPPALPHPRQRRPPPSTKRRPAPSRHQPPSRVLSPVVRQLAQAANLDLADVTPTGPGGVVTRKDVEVALARRAAAAVTPAERQAPPRPAARPNLRASPRAKQLAARLGVDLAGIAGSGPGGAVIGRDLNQATVPRPAPIVAVSHRDRAGTAERQQALNTAVANLMARAKREIPHYYLSTTIDMSSALAWVDDQNAARAIARRLLPVVLLLKATARAALRVPEMNGYWIDDGFQPQPEVHLGVAISLRGGGLLAPTIPSADQCTVDELMDRLRDLVAHARCGSLLSSEMSPPTLTVTNLGEEGVECVFPVIYPPQVAMVGFGSITPRPWAVQGMIGVRPLLTASLAADHRVSDGHRGARFLNCIDRLLQEPHTL